MGSTELFRRGWVTTSSPCHHLVTWFQRATSSVSRNYFRSWKEIELCQLTSPESFADNNILVCKRFSSWRSSTAKVLQTDKHSKTSK